jgi:DNA invertase Pin-like site-specific DNA recombinase
VSPDRSRRSPTIAATPVFPQQVELLQPLPDSGDVAGRHIAYLGRKPSFTREQFVKVRAMLGQQAVGVARIAKETGLTRQTVYRIKGDPRGAEAALVAWGL